MARASRRSAAALAALALAVAAVGPDARARPDEGSPAERPAAADAAPPAEPPAADEPRLPPPDRASLERALADLVGLDRSARARALDHLAKAGEPAALALGEALDGTDAALVAAALEAVPALVAAGDGAPLVGGHLLVEPLAARLAQDDQAPIRRRAAHALGALGRPALYPAAVPLAQAVAGDDDASVRLAALHALAGLPPSPFVAAALAAALADEDPRVRLAAAEQLPDALAARAAEPEADWNRPSWSPGPATSGAVAIGQALLGLWTHLGEDLRPAQPDQPDDNGSVSTAAEGDLGALAFARLVPDPDALEPLAALEAALADPEPAVRERAARALGVCGHAGHAAALAPRTSDPDRLVRQAALEALGTLPAANGPEASAADDAVIDALAAALASPVGAERHLALEALAARGPASARAIPALARVLGMGGNDGSVGEPASLRLRAIDALARTASDDALEPLAHALRGDPDPTVRARAAGALGGLTRALAPREGARRDGSPATPAAPLATPAAPLAAPAAPSADPGPWEPVDALADALADPIAAVRAAAAHTLADLGTRAAPRAADLARHCQDPEPAVAAAAARALAATGAAGIEALLARAAEARWVGPATATAVHALEGTAAIPAGAAEAQAAARALVPALAAGDRGVRLAALRYLARLGSAAEVAAPALVEALAADDDEVRSAALAALQALPAHAVAAPAFHALLAGEGGEDARADARDALVAWLEEGTMEPGALPDDLVRVLARDLDLDPDADADAEDPALDSYVCHLAGARLAPWADRIVERALAESDGTWANIASQIGPALYPPLAARLDHPDPAVQRAALVLFASVEETGPRSLAASRARDALVPRLADLAVAAPDEDVRVAASGALDLGGERPGHAGALAAAALTERLGNPDEEVRWRAAAALIALEQPGALRGQPLFDALAREETEDTRGLLEEAVRNLGLDELATALRHPDPRLRLVVAQSARGLAPRWGDVSDAALSLLEVDDPDLHEEAWDLVPEPAPGLTRRLPAYRRLLRHGAPEDRENALHRIVSARRLAADAAADLIPLALRDDPDDDDLRASAAVALAVVMLPRAAIAALTEARADPDADVRAGAWDATLQAAANAPYAEGASFLDPGEVSAALLDPDPRVIAAAETLVDLAQPEHEGFEPPEHADPLARLSLLLDQLGREDAGARRAAAAGLAALPLEPGPDGSWGFSRTVVARRAGPALAGAALDDPDEAVRIGALAALEAVGTTAGEGAALWTRLFAPQVAFVERHALARALQAGGGESVRVAVAGLADPRPAARAGAALLLRAIGAPAASAAWDLARALDDPDPDVALAVASSLEFVAPGLGADEADALGHELARRRLGRGRARDRPTIWAWRAIDTVRPPPADLIAAVEAGQIDPYEIGDLLRRSGVAATRHLAAALDRADGRDPWGLLELASGLAPTPRLTLALARLRARASDDAEGAIDEVLATLPPTRADPAAAAALAEALGEAQPRDLGMRLLAAVARPAFRTAATVPALVRVVAEALADEARAAAAALGQAGPLPADAVERLAGLAGRGGWRGAAAAQALVAGATPLDDAARAAIERALLDGSPDDGLETLAAACIARFGGDLPLALDALEHCYWSDAWVGPDGRLELPLDPRVAHRVAGWLPPGAGVRVREHTLPLLVALLASRDGEVAELAARSLAFLDDPEHGPAAIVVHREHSELEARLVLPVLDDLLAALASPFEQPVFAAARVLGRVGPLAGERRAEVEHALADAVLDGVGDVDGGSAVREALIATRPSSERAALAIERTADIGWRPEEWPSGPAVARGWARAFHGVHADLDEPTAFALFGAHREVGLGDAEAARLLGRAARHRVEPVRQQALAALARLGPAAAPGAADLASVLEPVRAAARWEEALAALATLRAIGPPARDGARPAVVALLVAGERGEIGPAVEVDAAWTLGVLGAGDAAAEVLVRLAERDRTPPGWRGAAWRAVGALGRRELAQRLREALGSLDPHEAEGAAEALAALGDDDPETLTALLVAARAHRPVHGGPGVMGSAAALARVAAEHRRSRASPWPAWAAVRSRRAALPSGAAVAGAVGGPADGGAARARAGALAVRCLARVFASELGQGYDETPSRLVDALVALGPHAAPALPELRRLVRTIPTYGDESRTRLEAAAVTSVLEPIGPPAVPLLLEARCDPRLAIAVPAKRALLRIGARWRR